MSEYSALLQQFYSHGWVYQPDFLRVDVNQALLQEASEEAVLTAAGVGRQTGFQLNQQIRRDQTLWFDGNSQPQQQYLAVMQQLQLLFNQHFFLGLFDFECHYARYQQGDFYQKHLDAFRGRSNRVLTTVSYLNSPVQGGELVLYDEQDQQITSIKPIAGSILIFESERFPHEVLPVNDTRYSIAGWFRRNNSVNGYIDPTN